ncbi:hypothetical protein GCWU000324_00690 [Kingella oralis ATCC 51147]|uniref:Uncharacterized protein n=1 Tax=Kingella oralis ATCC 51147 TaxID=629741 RepID=C4GEY0_9NEIS|nr:hypothetical protein GCWU000324_00690 [Kingella oralis ATCC 51147]
MMGTPCGKKRRRQPETGWGFQAAFCRVLQPNLRLLLSSETACVAGRHKF